EDGHAAAIARNARMARVDMDHRFALQLAADALLLEADQERAPRDRARQVAGVPAVALDVEVLAAVATEQRDGLEAAGLVLAEEDRILALHLGELGRPHRHQSGGIAKFGAEVGQDAQVLVGQVIEQLVLRHFSSGSAARRRRTAWWMRTSPTRDFAP